MHTSRSGYSAPMYPPSARHAHAVREGEMKAKTDSKKLTPEVQFKALIAKFDAKSQTLIRSVRSALRKRFPAANELVYDYSHSLVVGYSPSEHGIESIVSFAARADGVSLYFNKGPELPDPGNLLQ